MVTGEEVDGISEREQPRVKKSTYQWYCLELSACGNNKSKIIFWSVLLPFSNLKQHIILLQTHGVAIQNCQ